MHLFLFFILFSLFYHDTGYTCSAPHRKGIKKPARKTDRYYNISAVFPTSQSLIRIRRVVITCGILRDVVIRKILSLPVI